MSYYFHCNGKVIFLNFAWNSGATALGDFVHPAHPIATPLLWAQTFQTGLMYRVAQNKIHDRRICNISATGGLILKILEAT